MLVRSKCVQNLTDLRPIFCPPLKSPPPEEDQIFLYVMGIVPPGLNLTKSQCAEPLVTSAKTDCPSIVIVVNILDTCFAANKIGIILCRRLELVKIFLKQKLTSAPVEPYLRGRRGDVNDISNTLKLLARIIRGLAEAIGANCEIVLHDLSTPEHSIIAIENGHVTGRELGDALDDFGLEIIRSGKEEMINYRATTKDGKQLRSSFICLRDHAGQLFGMICVNYDVTEFIRAAKLIDGITGTSELTVRESFQKDIDEVLGELIQEAIRGRGKAVEEMNREDKISIIAYLDLRGAFLIRYSVDRAASLLNISKFTIYNYLEEIKSRQAQTASKATG